jgi:uncharacterized membrane protein
VKELLELLGGRSPLSADINLSTRELPGWLFVSALVLAAAALVAGWYAARTPGRARPRVLLWLLRLLALATLCLLVAGPELKLELSVPVASKVAVLVDVSASMALDAGPEGGHASRLQAALAELEQEPLAGMLQPRRLLWYGFGERLRPESRQTLNALQPADRRSAIGEALEELGRRPEINDVGFVVLLSDGADPALSAEGSVKAWVGRWPSIPVVVPRGLGRDGFRDVALTRPRHQRLGFVRHELSFDMLVVAHGVAGSKLQLTLKQDGAPVTTSTLVVTRESEEIPISLQTTPLRAGTFLYSVSVQPLAGEAVANNNSLSFPVEVRRDQIRVLQVAGRPVWDVRFLRRLLKSDPNVDLVSFFILRETGDPPGVPEDELSLIPFPVVELFGTALPEFDVVIFQDFGRRQFLTHDQLAGIARFVNSGGGFLMLGGELAFGAGGYNGTPIETVLPVELVTDEPLLDAAPFRPRLTSAGQRHYVTRVELDARVNASHWGELVPLEGCNRVGRLTPGAVALLEHPEARLDGGAPMPVLAVASRGRGRSMAFAVDTSWYWHFRQVGAGGTPQLYQQLWRNAVRWLAHEPSSKFVSLSAAADSVRPEEALTLEVRARGSDYRPAAGARVGLEWSPASGGAEPERSEGVTDARGHWATSPRLASEGFYRARALLRDQGGVLLDQDQLLFEVNGGGDELRDVAPRPGLLARIAETTGGGVMGPGSAVPESPELERYRVTGRRSFSLWDNALVFAALLLMLGLEWWWRRRLGLR